MDIMHITLLTALAIAVAGMIAVAKRDVKEIKIAVHKWASKVAAAFSKAGLSQVIFTPLMDLAADDIDSMIGSGELAAHYLSHSANWEKEFLNMLAVALADPILGPKVKKFFADVAAGAPAAQLQADADDIAKSSPFTDVDQANADLEDAVHQIVNSSAHPELAAHIDRLPAGQKFLAGLLVAGKAAAANAAPDTPDPSGTQPATVMPIPQGAKVTIEHP